MLFALLVVGLGCAGCATDPENESEKPWSSPEGWQGGTLPLQMMQPH